MLIFVEGGKPDNPEKNRWGKYENQQQTQPTYELGPGNRTRATLVGGERDHHCAIPALQICRGFKEQDLITCESKVQFLVSLGS